MKPEYKLKIDTLSFLNSLEKYASNSNRNDEIYSLCLKAKEYLEEIASLIPDSPSILVKDMKIKPWPKRSFLSSSYETLDDLISAGKYKLLKINGVGKKCIESIEKEYGIKL